MRRCSLLVAVLVLLVPMLACGGVPPDGAADAAREFCALLAADRMDEAYDMTNQQIRGDLTREEFTESMRSQRGVVGHTSTDLEEVTTQVGFAGRPSEVVVSGTIESADVTRHIELHMQHDGEHWKVGQLDLAAVVH